MKPLFTKASKPQKDSGYMLTGDTNQLDSNMRLEFGISLPMTADIKSKRQGKRRFLTSRTKSFVGIFLYLLVFSPISSNASEELMLKDINALALMLPGIYSNIQQYHKHVQVGLPSNRRHFLLRSEIYQLSSPMFNDTVTFYFQDFTKASSKPFRAGFYSFFPHSGMKNVIRMRTLKIKKGAFRNRLRIRMEKDKLDSYALTLALRNSGVPLKDLRTYGACDMFWKRIEENTFVGYTGAECLGSLGKDQVRIGVSMTLTKEKLLLTEGWYKIKDGTRITEVKVPYVLEKLPPSSTHPNSVALPNNNENLLLNDHHVEEKHLDDSTFHSLRRKKTKKEFRARKNRKNQRKGKEAKHRTLRNFRQVASALTSGYDVSFKVELSACSMPEQVKLDRFSFGGKIKDFVFVRQDQFKNRRKDYLYFVAYKTVMGSQGPEYITRHFNLLRGGRVEVRVSKSFSDQSRVNLEYTFGCRLYSDQKGYGGVKLSLNSGTKVKRLNSFKTVMSSMEKGRDLHLVADLARCQGSRNKPSIVVGSRVSDYDIVNKGKTLEVFIPFIETETSAQSPTPTSGFVVQILKNGDVELTRIGGTSPLATSSFHLSPAYHCKLSNRNAVKTNDDNEHSVKLFYNK